MPSDPATRDERALPRRRLLAASALALSSTLAGCGDTDEPDEDSEDDPDEQPEPDDDAPDDADDTTDDTDDGPERSDASELLDIRETLGTDAPLFDADTTTFAGSGRAATSAFPLDGALTVVAFEHDGERSFTVELEGPRDTQVFSGAGAVAGANAVPTASGEYRLDVTADGDRVIHVGQPTAPDAEIRTPDVTAHGDGPAVVGPVELAETTTVSARHESDDGTFIAEAFSEDATSSIDGELLFTEPGAFQGETRVDPVGVAWIDVEAAGAWRLSIEA